MNSKQLRLFSFDDEPGLLRGTAAEPDARAGGVPAPKTREFQYQSRELPADGPHERVEEGFDRQLQEITELHCRHLFQILSYPELK